MALLARRFALLWLLQLAAASLAEAGNRLSACGGVGQRGCCLHEIVPSCDSGLVERVGQGPGTGRSCGTVLGVPVFAAGTWYILRLMAHTPAEGEPEPAELPIRSAGITPAASVDRRREEGE